MSTFNKTILFLTFLLILSMFTLTGRGQTGFVLTSVVTHGGFRGGVAVWNLGTQVSVSSSSPSLSKLLAELEGKKVELSIKPINP